MNSSELSRNAQDESPNAVGWLVTTVIAFSLIGGSFWWRYRGLSDGDAALARTRAIVTQKIRSLQAYNQEIAPNQLLEFLAEHTGRPVAEDVFASITEVMTGHIVPKLWHDGQQASRDERFISHRAMASVIERHFPREILPNADVVVFPSDAQLRIVVAEAPQDHLRDSGWHWRWIKQYLDGLPPVEQRELKELDIYAAEELSELLSVLAVALVEQAARGTESSVAIDASRIQMTYRQIAQLSGAKIASDARASHDIESKPKFSAKTKERMLGSIAQPMFQDVTDAMQLDFVHRPKHDLILRRIFLELPLGIAGGGVAAGDYDGDGFTDLYFAGDDSGQLYRNINGQRFAGDTQQNDWRHPGETRAGYFVDFDNDGDLDLFVTFVAESNRLYQNDGRGRFTDITSQVHLSGDPTITHGAVWFDMDNDGLLDLYTAEFGMWTEGAVPTLGRINTNGVPNRFYHHRIRNGQHSFVEVGEKMGVDDYGWTHCVGAWDFDQDGFVDLFSLNDFGASLVYRNMQGRRFEEVSRTLKLDALYNSMNFTLMDITHDGHPAIYVSQIMKLTHRQRYRRPTEDTQIVFSPENIDNLRTLVSNRLFQRQANGSYEDIHNDILEPAELGWAWDASAMDYENDGDLDLVVLNGTESKVPGDRRSSSQSHVDGRLFLLRHAEQKNVFYMSEGGYFYDVSEKCPLAYNGNSRGSAFFDFDNDGDLDIAINDYFGPAKIFENRQNSGNHWIRLQLQGTGSNRDAIGARVEVRFGDHVRHDQVVSGSGFLSQNPMHLHFGLGSATQVDRVHIAWPSGRVQQLKKLKADQMHVIRESQRE